MSRANLAKLANELAVISRRRGAPWLSATSSATVVAHWLQWNDPNGAHLPTLAQAEGCDPYSADEAWDALAEMIEAAQ